MLDKKLVPETIPFDFDENYEFVKGVFAEYGYDVQEGSNVQQSAMIMSYLVSMLNANTAVNINELLLPTSRKRENVLKNARTMGYEIKHISSFRYKLSLKFGPGTHKINQYDYFTVGDNVYYYMGDVIHSIQENDVVNIEVVQGDLKKFSENENLKTLISVYNTESGKQQSDYFVEVPYTNIENEYGLTVYVEEPGKEVEQYFSLSDFIIDSDSVGKKGFIRLDDIEFKTSRIYFKFGAVGRELPDNTMVYVNALISKGPDGKMVYSEFSDIETSLNCEIVGVELISNGNNEESLDSVKNNAPLFYNSANRIVTKNDIQTFVNRMPFVENSMVWDGNDEYPPKPGNVWYTAIASHIDRTFLPNTEKNKWELQKRTNTESDKNNWYLTQTNIDEIDKKMDPVRVPTLIYHHRNPVYMDFKYKINVLKYNRTQSPEDWNTDIFNTINNYFLGIPDTLKRAEQFNFEYFQSNLTKRIDTMLTDITGFNISLENSISLTEKNIINEAIAYNDNMVFTENQVIFHLGTPYENFVTWTVSNEPIVDSTNLPKISSVVNGKTLSVDFNTSTNLAMKKGVFYPVKLDNVVVGKYSVLTDGADTIEVILEVGTELTVQNFIDEVVIDVEYASPNFKVSRNTAPLLKTVEFINR